MPLLERSKLYQNVWSRPCTKIAAELGISCSALKRICIEMNLPTPIVGHWTRVQCGKRVSKDPFMVQTDWNSARRLPRVVPRTLNPRRSAKLEFRV